MNGLITSSVIGTGYLLNKNNKNSRNKEKTENLFPKPNNQFVYNSNYYDNAKNKEQKLANRNFFNAKDSINTNIIPSQFNNSIINNSNLPGSNNPQSNNNKIIKSNLSGLSLNKDQFTHNNQVPFFGSRVKQNVNVNANQSIIETFTGSSNLLRNKKEQTPLFEPTKDINTQYGTQNNNHNLKNRINTTQYRQNEVPFEKVIVGPGINKGYNANPSGGFHPDIREYVMPKTIDELRPKSNPQISYNGRVIPGKSSVGKQTKVGKVEKYRPDTFYVQNPDRYLTTTGAYLKETKRPHIILKDTNRKYSKAYTPSAGPAVKKNQTAHSLYKKSSKNVFKKDGPRNAFNNNAWEDKGFGDYGKNAIDLPANERDITGKRTHITNFTSIVKALVAPILDVMKTTKKENVEGNIRQTGNLGASGVSKNVVWDPNDVAKTTIKETNIHDNRSGNMGSNQKGVAYDPTDVARTTIKETNIHDNRSGNVGPNQKGVAYDPNDIARTTIKETNIHDNRSGNVGPNQKGVAYDPNDIARTTIKETNIHDNRSGNVGPNQKGVAYDPNDIARTTIKETNIHDNRTGNIQSTTVNGGTVLDKHEMKFRTTIRETTEPNETVLNMQAYQKGFTKDPNDVARTTIKETNIHDVRTGNLRGPVKLTTYDPNDVARTTIKETNIHDVRTGHVGGITKDSAYLTNDVSVRNTNRQFTSDYEYEGIADSSRTGLGYLTNKKDARNTNRQFTSDREYEGGANSMYKKPKTYDTAYNMQTNGVRESTLVGRYPTPEGVKIPSGREAVNMESKKIEGDVINTRELVSSKVYNSIQEMKMCSVTKEKNNYNYEIMDERIDPDLLSAFRKNPYTKSLNSF